MAHISSPRLPNELISHIIYQYILGICFKDVLKLRLVSGFFDLEVIRALLETIDYRPRAHIKWYPLTNRLINHLIRNADAGDQNYGGYCKRTIDTLVHDFPGRIDITKYQRKLADMQTHCVPEKFIVNRLHSIEEFLLNRACYGPLFAAIVCDEVDIVEELWKQREPGVLDAEEIWPVAMNQAVQAGSLDAMKFLLARPEASRWMQHEDGPLILTPLVLAARYGKLEVAKFLITSNACYDGEMPQEIVYVTQEAAKHGHVDLVIYFAEFCMAYGERQRELGSNFPSLGRILKSAILGAVQAGQTNVVEAMLREDFLEQMTGTFSHDFEILYQAFWKACNAGKVKCARLLLETDSLSQWRKTRNRSRYITANVACEVEMVDLLLEYDIPIGPNFYSMATQSGQAETLRWIHESGVVSGEPEITALAFSRAVQNGYIEVVRFITTTLGMHVVKEDLSYHRPQDDVDGQRSIFRGDPILTAMVNGQDRLVKALLNLSFMKNPLPDEAAAKFADGTYPLTKTPYECVTASVAMDHESNVQVWARNVAGAWHPGKKKYTHSNVRS